MSIFNKTLASIGIGNAKIDTQLEKSNYQVGEIVRGKLVIQGGNTEQKIDSIHLSLRTLYYLEKDDKKVLNEGVISTFLLSNSFTIHTNEKKEIPFHFQLPYHTPITAGKSKVWLNTELNIPMAIDPSDKDYINVKPAPLMNSVLQAIKNLGFQMNKVENAKPTRQLRTKSPFIQEFEYRPTSAFRSYLDEIEVTFIRQDAHEAVFVLQVDRRARGLRSLISEVLETDETFIRVTVTSKDIPTMQTTLENIIRRYMTN